MSIANASISLLASKGGRVITQSRVETLSGNWSDLTLLRRHSPAVQPDGGNASAGIVPPVFGTLSLRPWSLQNGLGLKEPIPWKAKEYAERLLSIWAGQWKKSRTYVGNARIAGPEAPERPFVLLAQPTLCPRKPSARRSAISRGLIATFLTAGKARWSKKSRRKWNDLHRAFESAY